jgi:AraC-like DNA-binding protein
MVQNAFHVLGNRAQPTVARGSFRGPPGGNLQAYSGVLTGGSPDADEMTVEKHRIGPYQMYRLWAQTASPHGRVNAIIRGGAGGKVGLWFMRRGRITVIYSGGRHTVSRGEFTGTAAARPHSFEFAGDAAGQLELAVLVLPEHLFGDLTRVDLATGQAHVATSGDFRLADQVFELLGEYPGAVDADIAEQLIAVVIEGLGRRIQQPIVRTAPPSIADKRLADITRFVGQHFSNPDLSAKLIATHCGISVRYLCHLTRANGLSLSHMIWEKRIAMAREWLSDQRMQRHSISEIAYLVGFKSSAHFTRKFKEQHGVSPREFRNLALRMCKQAQPHRSEAGSDRS